MHLVPYRQLSGFTWPVEEFKWRCIATPYQGHIGRWHNISPPCMWSGFEVRGIGRKCWSTVRNADIIFNRECWWLHCVFLFSIPYYLFANSTTHLHFLLHISIASYIHWATPFTVRTPPLQINKLCGWGWGGGFSIFGWPGGSALFYYISRGSAPLHYICISDVALREILLVHIWGI